MTSAINHFIEKIRGINESDYGDFMRSANLYLNELKEELGPACDQNCRDQLDKMQLHLQFYPTWEVESSRQKVIDEAEVLALRVSQVYNQLLP